MYVAVGEKNDVVHVYDVRKCDTNQPCASFDLSTQHSVLQECHFSPCGQHLVAATKSSVDGMGQVRIWRWNTGGGGDDEEEVKDDASVFVGHTGPIYTLAFSPDGTRLATGGSDALVGLWDVSTMVCASTITRRTKFVRSVAFSYDSKFVASCSEEDGVDISLACDGSKVGLVSLSSTATEGGGGGGGQQQQQQQRGYQMNYGNGIGGGADEICFHPKAYIIACARNYSSTGGGGGGGGSGASGSGAGASVGDVGVGRSGSPPSPPPGFAGNQSQVTIARLVIT